MAASVSNLRTPLVLDVALIEPWEDGTGPILSITLPTWQSGGPDATFENRDQQLISLEAIVEEFAKQKSGKLDVAAFFDRAAKALRDAAFRDNE